jgi:ABC-type branched-subunit amino acid transport system substrate-binding protein
MRSIVPTFFIIFIVLVSFTLLTQADQYKKRFKAGLIFPLSGAVADYGIALRNGFELEQEEKPEFFKKIEFIYQDSLYDEKSSLSAFYALEQRGYS